MKQVIAFIMQQTTEYSSIQDQALDLLFYLFTQKLYQLAQETSSLTLHAQQSLVNSVDVSIVLKKEYSISELYDYCVSLGNVQPTIPFIPSKESNESQESQNVKESNIFAHVEVVAHPKPSHWESHLPGPPPEHSYKDSKVTWRPDAYTKSILQRRNNQIRQVEENLKRLLIVSSKYERKMEKSLSKMEDVQLTLSNGVFTPMRDMGLVNYEFSRFGIDGLIRKRSAKVEIVEED